MSQIRTDIPDLEVEARFYKSEILYKRRFYT